MEEPTGRRVKVRYRFLGTTNELADTFPLAGGEKVVAEGSVRVRTGVGFRRRGDLRLTQQRLVLVSHYAFQPDRGFELPRGSITGVIRSGSTWTLHYRTGRGDDQLTVEEHLLLEDAFRDAWSADVPKGI